MEEATDTLLRQAVAEGKVSTADIEGKSRSAIWSDSTGVLNCKPHSLPELEHTRVPETEELCVVYSRHACECFAVPMRVPAESAI